MREPENQTEPLGTSQTPPKQPRRHQIDAGRVKVKQTQCPVQNFIQLNTDREEDQKWAPRGTVRRSGAGV